jgi:hypothetical protein
MINILQFGITNLENGKKNLEEMLKKIARSRGTGAVCTVYVDTYQTGGLGLEPETYCVIVLIPIE